MAINHKIVNCHAVIFLYTGDDSNMNTDSFRIFLFTYCKHYNYHAKIWMVI